MIQTVGEAIYAPRMIEYSVTVAPMGREGTYVALSSAPLFAAKLVGGGVSGGLLQRYCPGIGSNGSPGGVAAAAAASVTSMDDLPGAAAAGGGCDDGAWIYFLVGCLAVATSPIPIW
eukprot:COSAG02_NODE_421_length_22605_cov_158.841198_12_plen_117_part_00